jgi:hypothetical protein
VSRRRTEEAAVPPMPWTRIRDAEPDTRYLVMATHLPLTRYRYIPSFLVQTMRIRRQLARSEGLVGYSLDAKLLKRQFRTVSAWTTGAEAQRFARAEPHAAIMAVNRPRMGPTRFLTWEATGSDLPISWAMVAERLEAPAA